MHLQTHNNIFRVFNQQKETHACVSFCVTFYRAVFPGVFLSAEGAARSLCRFGLCGDLCRQALRLSPQTTRSRRASAISGEDCTMVPFAALQVQRNTPMPSWLPAQSRPRCSRTARPPAPPQRQGAQPSFQISSLYCTMVRSDENQPARAMFTSALRLHARSSAMSESMRALAAR